ncbi:MarR family winged helix-turn-helix transcriptional regulator [Sporofaciens sp. SGI.106]|uniref:MarR family winged helix-turn-helix transcriptional regulator n=1 Tax=Sporofaciens sp. SGI.106 TaxID=3420568 RepID=UPI003CFDF1EA
MSFDLSVSNLNTENIDAPYYLIGLINRFNNSFQAAADNIFEELSWKQILSKLEKQGFVEVHQDSSDKRKQRIILTDKAKVFRILYDEPSKQAIQLIFGNISEEELLTTISVFTRLNKNVDKLKGRME